MVRKYANRTADRIVAAGVGRGGVKGSTKTSLLDHDGLAAVRTPPLSSTHPPLSSTRPPISSTHPPLSSTHPPLSSTYHSHSRAPPRPPSSTTTGSPRCAPPLAVGWSL
eukprot:1132388-Prorocentrum_minimum.AAC.1